MSTGVSGGMWMQVTPSSKVVGDLAQFMVQNQLDDKQLVEKAANLNLPGRSFAFPQSIMS